MSHRAGPHPIAEEDADLRTRRRVLHPKDVPPKDVRPKARPAIAILACLALCACLDAGEDVPAGAVAAEATESRIAVEAPGAGELPAIADPSAAPATPAGGPSFDLGAVMRQVHFAYRQEGGTWAAAHETYAVRVGADGRIGIAPVEAGSGRRGAALELRTVRAGRAGEGAGAEAADLTGDAKGGLRIGRGAVVERLANGEDGVEQSWEFASAPSGGGDLVVAVEVSGQVFAGESVSGLHFADPASGLGLRYGHGTWRDATGRETAVPATWDGAAIRLTVPADVVEESAFPAVLDPVIGPEFGLDEPVYSNPRRAEQGWPAMSCNGDVCLVTWISSAVAKWNLYAVRVTLEGQVIDRDWMIVTQVDTGTFLNVAWSDNAWLVAWAYNANNIKYMRLTAELQVLDPTPHEIPATAQLLPGAIAANGNGWMIPWTDSRSYSTQGYDVYAARIAQDGTLLDPVGIPVATGVKSQMSPRCGWDGTSWLVAWVEPLSSTNTKSGTIRWTRITAEGTLLDPGGRVIVAGTVGSGGPALSWNGQYWLLAWTDFRTDNPGLYAGRFLSDGTRLDATDIPVSLSSGIRNAPEVAWNGSRWLMTWDDDRNRSTLGIDIYAARIEADGTVVDPAGFPIVSVYGDQYFKTVAPCGDHWCQVWADFRTSYPNNYGAVIRDTGTSPSIQEFVVSVAPNIETNPAAAWNGSEWFVTWLDDLNITTRAYSVRGVRVRPDGTALDAPAIFIADLAGNLTRPAVAWNGSHWLVVWEGRATETASTKSLLARRVAVDGTVIDATPLTILASSSQCVPWASSDGEVWLVLYQCYATGVTAVRIKGDGTIAGSAFGVTGGGSSTPVVGWNGANWLVAWTDTRNSTTTSYDIYAARITRTGAVLDPTGFPVSTASGSQSDPAVACNASDCLVAWTDGRDPTKIAHVYGTLVKPDRTVVSPQGIALLVGTVGESGPRVAWTGDRWYLSWTRTANSSVDPTKRYGAVLSTLRSVRPAIRHVLHIIECGLDQSLLEAGNPGGPIASVFASNRNVPYQVLSRLHARLVRASGDEDGDGRCFAVSTDYPDAECRPGGSGSGMPLDACDDEPRAWTTAGCATCEDGDGDGWYWGCDAYPGGDGPDKCPNVADPAQTDADGDGLGDACDGCMASVCDPNATCLPTFGPDVCSCNAGYAGTGTVCADVDECLTANGGCAQVCTNSAGSYACSCGAGWVLAADGHACSDVNECLTANGGCTQVCTNAAGSYACSCAAGWVLAADGHACNDVNECLAANGGCAQVCTNSAGSYACSCNTGWVLAADGHACNDVNECLTANGGCAQVCTNSAGSYACSCAAGWVLAADGHACSDVNECLTANGGCAQVCTNSAGSYACSCAAGWVLAADGHACNDVNECLTANGGCAQVCTNSAGSYVCSCAAGWVLAADGHACSDVNECLTANGGCAQVCTNSAGSFACSCAAGWVLASDGLACNDVNECLTANGGCAQVCTNSAGSYVCSCAAGWVLAADGHACSDVNECLTANGGCAQVCTNSAGSYACSCNPGWVLAAEGHTCNDVNECLTANGGCAQVCTNSVGSYACSCAAGWVLAADGHACEDVDECAVDNGGCSDWCTNREGAYVCGCPKGWALGPDGRTCQDVDECLAGTSGCTQICTNTIGSYFCGCESGWVLAPDGRTCEDVDECLEGNGGCQQVCTNLPGTWKCGCGAGWALAPDGRACNDVDECLTANGGCAQVCTNSAGSYACSCNAGWVSAADGRACEDVDECASNNGGCAQVCTNSAGSYVCSCNAGWVLAADGHACSDVNECLTANGGCAQVCTNTAGSYACSCAAGWVLAADGHACSDVNECLTANGGCAQVCTNSAGSYACSCDTGWVLAADGHTCSDVNECLTANGGCAQVCTNSAGSYACSCGAGWVLAADGRACSDVNECLTANGGCAQVCTNSAGSYACSCDAGWVLAADGHACSDVNECLTANGGCAQVCTNTAGSHGCWCETGWTLAADGHACDDVDECGVANGGCAQVCGNLPGTYVCTCNPGWLPAEDGHACRDVNECLTANGGCAEVCTNTAGAYACSCGAGWVLAADGRGCDDVDECATANGGCAQVCTNAAGTYACSCGEGYGLAPDGRGCEDLACGVACTVGVGPCAAMGTFSCDGDGQVIGCDAVPGLPAAESCNGVDDDCDGPADEDGGLCDDGDPCTTDACDGSEGCVHAAIAGCCRDALGCLPGQFCGVDHACAALLCSPCASDGDCGVAGARCLAVADGGACGLPCEDGFCPDGFACSEDEALDPVCAPVAEACACASEAAVVCRGPARVLADGCGVLYATLETCPGDCAAGACCPDGTVARDGVCVELLPDAPPEAGDSADASEEAVNVPDEAPVDAAVAEAIPEVSDEASADAAADLAPEVAEAPDSSPDPAPDVVPEPEPEPAPEPAPEPVPDHDDSGTEPSPEPVPDVPVAPDTITPPDLSTDDAAPDERPGSDATVADLAGLTETSGGDVTVPAADHRGKGTGGGCTAGAGAGVPYASWAIALLLPLAGWVRRRRSR